MAKRTSLLLSMVLIACLSATSVNAGVNVGVSFDKDGLSSFQLAIGDHYQAPQREIVAVRGQLSDEEMPVVFIIASGAGVTIPAVLKLRAKGMSWMDINVHFGLSPNVFYVPLDNDPGPPYGKAYGHFKNKKGKKAKKIHLTDREIIDWANLRFLSEYHHTSPAKIIKSKKSGHNFVTISKNLKAEAKKQREKSQRVDKPKSKQKGKGKKR